MTIDRRFFLAGSAATLSLTGCAYDAMAAPIPGQGWVVQVGRRRVAKEYIGRAVIEGMSNFTPETPFRIASITKLVVAMALRDLAQADQLDLDAPVRDMLPDTPDGLTLGHLLSHQSGLRDPDVYWADIETDIRSLYNRDSFTHAPGTAFRYSNLNYGLAATVVEARLKERFDVTLLKWFMRQGLDAGLNWSGVSPRKRRKAAALYRKDENTEWTATIDLPDDIPLASPTYLGRERQNLEGYQPGFNGTLFSPQGGMRMSLSDLIRIGELLRERPDFHTPIWTFDGGNGDDEDAHFLAFGPGSYVYTPELSPIPGVPLVGHLGWAYGAHTGLFIVPGTDISFAFAQLGSGPDEATMTHDGTFKTPANQFTVHQALFDAVAESVRAHI